jgi:hypothetical protein
VRLPVLAAPQRLLELLFVQPDLTGQPGQHADLADVLPFASVEVEEFYLERTPRSHGYLYRGMATK